MKTRFAPTRTSLWWFSLFLTFAGMAGSPQAHSAPTITTFTNPTPAGGDLFGDSMAAVGSDRVLIGAYQDDTGADNAGAAYLFSTNGTLLTTFTNPTPAGGDIFGYSVAAVGSDRVVIGAPQYDTGAFDPGAAYLFSTNGTLLTTFTNPTPEDYDAFGYSVAAMGSDQMLIGAVFDNTGATDAGAAYLFSTDGTLLTTFTNPAPAVGDWFGCSVAAVGSDRVLIGALHDTGATDAGAAYLFSTNGTLLTTFTNPTPANGDQFGVSVAAVGSDRVLISAYLDDTGATDAGAAYLFSTNGTLLATFNNPTPANDDEFGISVAAVGSDRVLIGAPQDDTGAPDAGAAYLFSTNGTLLATFTNPTPAAGDSFGDSVAVVGSDRVLIGAYFDDTVGAAYLISLSEYAPAPVNVLVQGNGTVIRNPDQPLYTNGQMVTLTGVEGNCYWRFSQWSDGVTNNPRTITVSASNLYMAVFTNTVPLEELVFKQWDKCFGGTNADSLSTVQHTTDGGYILGGTSQSSISGNKTNAGFGAADYWIVKLDAAGEIQWQRTFGGTGEDQLNSLQQTVDGGYIVSGVSASGVSGNKTATNYGNYDFWIIKLDVMGTQQWEQSFGGTLNEDTASVRQTTEGGYIIGGQSWSSADGNKTTSNAGLRDYWLIKTDPFGNKQWEKSFGGSGDDNLLVVRQAGDGGYLLAGLSSSGIDGSKTVTNYGANDWWIIKTDTSGNESWQRGFGTDSGDALYAVQATSDGGSVLGGYSGQGSFGNKAVQEFGGYDFWLIKLDGAGNTTWQQSAGGTGQDEGRAIIQTQNGGYLMAGISESGSSGSKLSLPFGGIDGWAVRTDGNGVQKWEIGLGGSGFDELVSADQSGDGGYLLGGTSDSMPGGNKTAASFGSNDFWVVKLSVIEAPFGAPVVCAEGQLLIDGSITITNCQPITLRTSFTNGTIRYTLDGSAPGPGSTLYTGQFTLPAGSTIINAIAYSADLSQSVTNCGVQVITVPGQASVPVTVIVQGNGTVIRTPDQMVYTNCQTVTLTAMPTNCYWRFSQWSDGVSTYTNNPLTITVGPTNSFTAVFTNVVIGCETNGPRPFGAPVIIVNGQTVTNDSVTVNNFASVEIQTSFTNGNIYYTFDCSPPTTGSTNYTAPFTVIGLVTVRAVAVSADSSQIVESCPVTIRVEPHSDCPSPFSFFQLAATTFGGEGHGGTVRRVPAFTPYPCERVVTVIATPDTGWEFLGWLGGADGPNPSVTFTMNRDICAQAVFAAPLMTLAGLHGSVTRQPETALYPYGTEVRLTAVPDAGYFFTNWTGVVSGSDNPLSVLADNPFAVLIANFAPLPATNQHALTTGIEGCGWVETDPYDFHYAAGTLVTNTAQPDANQTFLRWEGDTNGAVFLDATRLVLTMNTSKVVTAHFTSRPQLDIVRCLGGLNREGFELSVTGDLGARYLIQATPSLNPPIAWTTLGEVTNVLGVVEFLDITNTNFTKRFYRAQVAP